MKEQHTPIVENNTMLKSDLDRLVLKYLQAININEHINPGANALIGSLWRNLYWMSRDILDDEFFGCHPCINTSSIKMKTSDVFEKVIPALTEEYIKVSLPRYEV